MFKPEHTLKLQPHTVSRVLYLQTISMNNNRESKTYLIKKFWKQRRTNIGR